MLTIGTLATRFMRSPRIHMLAPASTATQRKLLRNTTKLAEKCQRLPGWADKLAILTIVGAAALYGSVQGGQFDAAANHVAVEFGFGVTQIDIAGQVYTDPREVYGALGLNEPRSVFTLKNGEAEAALVSLPWVESARVRIGFPDSVEVELTERQAYAAWQFGETVSVIDQSGEPIVGVDASRVNALPLLVGEGAPAAAGEFFELIANYPEITDRVRAYMLVGGRRWDLNIDSGVVVSLPETNTAKALDQLATLETERSVFDRDIASIDLRIQGQAVFALTENAMTARSTKFKEIGIDIMREEKAENG
ncbi:MAG: FtsQ-type POTRA domain-containing protein [Pseudomonadota bacterium]